LSGKIAALKADLEPILQLAVELEQQWKELSA
jgi:hypothetical protein